MPRDTTSDGALSGGEPACFAHLVCDECGAVVSEGHRPGCQAAGDAPVERAR